MNKFKRTIRIGDRAVGPGEKLFVIAEAGVNHNGDLDLAKQLIDVATKSRADAVKFQTFKPESLVTATAPKADYQLKTTESSESHLEMLKKLELHSDALRELCDYAHKVGITFLSTPFDEDSADQLEELDIPAFKVSSGDLTNTPLLQHIARKRRPMMLSTGMANLKEVEEAVATVGNAGCDELVLLHCVSKYPAEPVDSNLRAIKTLWETFDVPTGYSDHSEGIEISLAAAALGACLIEKHFTLSRTLPGPDHKASLEPAELETLIRGLRNVEVALGDGRKIPTPIELETALVARRSLVAAVDITLGTPLSREMIVCKRPGTGLPPSRIDSLLGRRVLTNITAGTLLQESMFD